MTIKKITEKNIRENRTKKSIYYYVKQEITILRRLHSKYIKDFHDVIENKNYFYGILIKTIVFCKNKRFNNISSLETF